MQRILISRPDAIGDVVLTLPLAGWLKRQWPDCQIIFLGRTYTAPVIKACEHVDEFVNSEEMLALPFSARVEQIRRLRLDAWLHVFPHQQLATAVRMAGVPIRVGTSRRWFHLLTCNRRVPLSRRGSDLHEAELNLQLLLGLPGVTSLPTKADIPNLYGLTRLAPLPDSVRQRLGPPPAPGKWRVIIHPKSRGSAREWPTDHFAALARSLHGAGHQVLLTGSASEGKELRAFREQNAAFITDLTGHVSLTELLTVIDEADALVAASTGPLHIASALGRRAVGLYPPLRPMHPGRWAPLGRHAVALTTPERAACADCAGQPAACHCLPEIQPAQVLLALQALA